MFGKLNDSFQQDVLTLNYDNLIDEILDDAFDGFTIDIGGGARSFDAVTFASQSEGSTLLHLHGSTLFGYLCEGEIAKPQIVKYPSLEDAMGSICKALKSPDSIRRVGDYGSLVATIAPIISGFQKAEKLMLEPTPFGYYYVKAVNQILRCSRILILGYGGGDPHINAWIVESARLHGPRYRAAYVYKASSQNAPVPEPAGAFLSNLAKTCGRTTKDSTGSESFGANIWVIDSGLPFDDSTFEAVRNFLS